MNVAWCLASGSRLAHRTHYTAAPTAAEEEPSSVTLETRDAGPFRHDETLQDRTSIRIDVAKFTFVILPNAVPQLPVRMPHEHMRTLSTCLGPALGRDP